MAGVETTIDFSGLQAILEPLERRGRNLAEFTPIAAETLVSAVLQVFEDEGPGWPPLAPSTRARKLGDPKLLKDTGVLFGSITGASDSESATAFTNVPYSKFHVEGTASMPARDFLAIDEEATFEEIAEAIVEDIAGGF